MNDLANRIANLDPGKRDVLLRRLGKGAVAASAVRPASMPAAGPAIVVDPEKNVTLEVASPGILQPLTWRPVARDPPAPGQVEWRREAWTLNFRAVLLALRAYPTLRGPTPAMR